MSSLGDVSGTIKKDLNPNTRYESAKDKNKQLKEMFAKPEIPGETDEQRRAREAQAETLAALNDEENRRLKRLLNAAQGLRAFRGSAMSRATPGNRAGSAANLFDAAAARPTNVASAGGGGSRPTGFGSRVNSR